MRYPRPAVNINRWSVGYHRERPSVYKLEGSWMRLGILAVVAATLAFPGGAEALQTGTGTAPSQRANRVEMRNVHFHVDSTVVLEIEYLRGALLTVSDKKAPVLDDKHSFGLQIDSAVIGISTGSLSELLNRHVFAYDNSPLRHLRVSTEGGRLKQQGTLDKGIDISFSVVGDVSVTEHGEIRLHPTSIKAAGMKVQGLMKFFGLELAKLVDLRQARGVRIEKNDFILSPAEMLPPPAVEGRLAAVRVEDEKLVQVFRPADSIAVKPLRPALPNARNYMYYEGGFLTFGKLTMASTDLQIIDADPGDPFDFYLDHYNDQLVAGYSKNTRDHGLVVYMPDFDQLQSGEVKALRPPSSKATNAGTVADGS